MPDVFVSYASEDRDRVRLLVDKLREDNICVSWDQDFLPGDIWQEKIASEIGESRSVIVVWSENSVISSWALDEVALCYGRQNNNNLRRGGTEWKVNTCTL